MSAARASNEIQFNGSPMQTLADISRCTLQVYSMFKSLLEALKSQGVQ